MKRFLLTFSCSLILVVSLFALLLSKTTLATYVFEDGFESGDYSAWVTSSSGGNTLEVVGTLFYLGSYSSHHVASAWTTCYVSKTLASAYSTLYARCYVRHHTLPSSGTETDMINIRSSTGSSILTVGIKNVAGTYYIDTWNQPSDQYVSAAITIDVDEWHCFEVKIVQGSSTGEWRVYYDGEEEVTATGRNTGANNYQAVRFGYIGNLCDASIEWHQDCCIVDVSYIGETAQVPSITVGSNVGTNSTAVSEPCLFYADWYTVLSNLSYYIFGTNNTGSWVNDTETAFPSEVDYGWSNITKTLNSEEDLVVGWEIWANNTAGNWTNTGLRSLLTSNVHRIYKTDFEKTDGWSDAGHSQLYIEGGTDEGIDNSFDYEDSESMAWIEGVENFTDGFTPHSGSRCIMLDAPAGIEDNHRVEFNIEDVDQYLTEAQTYYVSEWLFLAPDFGYNRTVNEWGSLGVAYQTINPPNYWPYTAFIMERINSGPDTGLHRMFMNYRDEAGDQHQLGYTSPYYPIIGEWFHREYFVYCGTEGNEDGFVTYWINGEMQFNVTGVQVLGEWENIYTTIAKLYYASDDTAGNRLWVDDFEIWDSMPTDEGEGNTVVLNQPSSGSRITNCNVNFNYTATFYQGSILNSSLWANVSGTWQRLGWNTTTITSGVMDTINYIFSADGTYIWNVQVFNSTGYIFAPTNKTVTISVEYYVGGGGWWGDWWG